MHLHASNWQHKFYFQHYTTPRDVPRQHSINSYLIPPLVLHLPSYLPPPSLLLQFYTVRRHIIMFSRTYCWCTEISTRAHDCCLCGKEKGKNKKGKRCLGCTGALSRCVRVFGCKSVYQKSRSTSQKATLKPVNKALAKFSEVTQGTVSGGT